MEGTIGIVLAGVHRWDEGGLDRLGPRPLLPVARRPLIHGALGWLRQAGVRRAVICANSSSRAVRQVVGDGSAFGLDLDYYEDWTPRGPAGCLLDAATAAGAERLIVTEGTAWPATEPAPLLAAHARAGDGLTVVVTEDKRGGLNGSLGAPGLVPVGLYVLERSVLEHVPATGYQDLKEVLLPRLHERGVTAGVWSVAPPGPRPTDVGTYLGLNAWVLSRRLGSPSPARGYRRVGDCEIHETAAVAATARLLGPVLVGPRTRVGPGAVVVGPTVLGDGGTLEAQAVVCRSVLWNDWWIGSRALVDTCVISDGVRVRPDAQLHHAVVDRVSAAGRLPSGSAGAAPADEGSRASRPLKLCGIGA